MQSPFQIQVGTQAGPITSPQQHQQLLGGMQKATQGRIDSSPYRRASSPAGMAAQQTFAQNMANNNNRNTMLADRSMTQANAQENLRSQQARAQVGLGFMGQAQQAQNQDMALQSQRRNMLLQFLQPYLMG